jgi:hypothetical protein
MSKQVDIRENFKIRLTNKKLVWVLFSFFWIVQGCEFVTKEIIIDKLSRTVYHCPARRTIHTTCDIVFLGFSRNEFPDCELNSINDKCSILIIPPLQQQINSLRYQSLPYPSLEAKHLIQLLWFDANGLQLRRGGTSFSRVRDQSNNLVHWMLLHLMEMDNRENTAYLGYYSAYFAGFYDTSTIDWRIPVTYCKNGLSYLNQVDEGDVVRLGNETTPKF